MIVGYLKKNIAELKLVKFSLPKFIHVVKCRSHFDIYVLQFKERKYLFLFVVKMKNTYNFKCIIFYQN